ncbi:N-acetylneuraminate synthase [Rubritalea sp.]|uniref:N-acetylneuraminate synthase n=1 Tax=Rubritalea sp. TaxID=2109375 RepID=UPI003EFA4F22
MLEFSKGKCLIIAEAGVNHNGDIELAKELIIAAKNAGADVVKFQTWVTELIVTEESLSADYQEVNTGSKSQFDLLKSLELTHDQFSELQEFAELMGIHFLSTPDEEVSARFLIDRGMGLIKVGSGELTNLPFLDFLAKERLPMIVSTGMATLAEVERAVSVIEASGQRDICLLHCVSNYPADPAECNLRAMQTMREHFECPIGYSDHTMGSEMCFAAVAMGAQVIEKHLTLDRSMDGPDHLCSSEPDEFADLVRGIRKIESGIGDGIKRPSSSELATRKVVRKEVVAARDILAGEVIRMGDIALKRGSGKGIGAEHLEAIIGKVTTSKIGKNSLILENSFESAR